MKQKDNFTLNYELSKGKKALANCRDLCWPYIGCFYTRSGFKYNQWVNKLVYN